MWHQIVIGLLLSVSNVLIHSLGSWAMFLWVLKVLKKGAGGLTLVGTWWLVVRIVIFLLLMHAVEVAVWAQFYVNQHCFSDAETAYYYSLMSYTTVGYGDVLLPHPWKIMGGLEAMIGVLMFGWSTATLAAFLHYLNDVRIRELRAHLGG